LARIGDRKPFEAARAFGLFAGALRGRRRLVRTPRRALLALPALAILSIQTRGWPRTISIAALCVVAVPWLAVWGTKQLLAASLFVCALTLWRMRVEMRTAVPIFVAIGAVLYGFELHPPQLPVPSGASLPIIAPGDLVQQAWQAYTAARSTPDLAWFAIKVPV
jgi:hypothetical protein